MVFDPSATLSGVGVTAPRDNAEKFRDIMTGLGYIGQGISDAGTGMKGIQEAIRKRKFLKDALENAGTYAQAYGTTPEKFKQLVLMDKLDPTTIKALEERAGQSYWGQAIIGSDTGAVDDSSFVDPSGAVVIPTAPAPSISPEAAYDDIVSETLDVSGKSTTPGVDAMAGINWDTQPLLKADGTPVENTLGPDEDQWIPAGASNSQGSLPIDSDPGSLSNIQTVTGKGLPGTEVDEDSFVHDVEFVYGDSVPKAQIAQQLATNPTSVPSAQQVIDNMIGETVTSMKPAMREEMNQKAKMSRPNYFSKALVSLIQQARQDPAAANLIAPFLGALLEKKENMEFLESGDERTANLLKKEIDLPLDKTLKEQSITQGKQKIVGTRQSLQEQRIDMNRKRREAEVDKTPYKGKVQPGDPIDVAMKEAQIHSHLKDPVALKPYDFGKAVTSDVYADIQLEKFKGFSDLDPEIQSAIKQAFIKASANQEEAMKFIDKLPTLIDSYSKQATKSSAGGP